MSRRLGLLLLLALEDGNGREGGHEGAQVLIDLNGVDSAARERVFESGGGEEVTGCGGGGGSGVSRGGTCLFQAIASAAESGFPLESPCNCDGGGESSNVSAATRHHAMAPCLRMQR